MTPGYRISRLSIHRAIRIKCRAANDNPRPSHIRERQMRELGAAIAQVTEKARQAGLYSDPPEQG